MCKIHNKIVEVYHDTLPVNALKTAQHCYIKKKPIALSFFFLDFFVNWAFHPSFSIKVN